MGRDEGGPEDGIDEANTAEEPWRQAAYALAHRTAGEEVLAGGSGSPAA